ncbi:MAG: hypothetical protein BroJett018_52870 [Chloroflexota bacterium]|nr:MAG: hypothetical protein BroJett018_52870 [Chloroflexota bacterium]
MFARTLKLTLLAFALLMTAVLPMRPAAHAQDDEPTQPRPLVVLMEFDPWKMVIGSDVPTFVLYDDGTIIYRNEYIADDPAATPEAYETGDTPYIGLLTLKLDEEELAAFLESLAVGDDFYALEPSYDGPMITDQPNIYLAVWTDEGQPKSVNVYGDLRNDVEDARSMAPDAFLSLYDALVEFVGEAHEGAVAWLPDQLELMVWPYESASSGAAWPDFLPTLDDPTTIDRGGLWSIYVDSTRYEEVMEFLNEAAGTVEIDGEFYSVMIRYPFPGADIWEAEMYGPA